VVLTLEPSAGVQIVAGSLSASQGLCDASVNVCMLGALPAGHSAAVEVSATITEPGSWPLAFSVTHHDADSNAANDSATVVETVQ
jgi:hypothetical protein